MTVLSQDAARLRPEFDLLLCCARGTVTAEVSRRMRALAHDTIDWDLVVLLASRHNVWSLVARNLCNFCPDLVPAAVLARLVGDANSIAAHNLFATAELRRIMAALATAGVPAAAFKGPALACVAYGSTSLRFFEDLDILVDRRRIKAARDALAAAGYHLPPQLAKSQQVLELRSQYCLPFLGPGIAPLTVELHCDVAPWYFSFPLDTTALLERAVPVQLPGGPVASLACEDLLLVLCMHGVKHVWPALEGVASIAGLLHETPELRWHDVLLRARRSGSERMLLLGCALARNLFDVRLPGVVTDALRHDPTVPVLAAWVEGRFHESSDNLSAFVGAPWFHMRCRERLRDRLRYCVRGVLAPEVDDARDLALPRFLFPLYSLVRPARVLPLYWKSVAQHFRTAPTGRTPP